MPDPLNNGTTATATEPRLQNRALEPKGVLQKNLKTLVYLGAALVLIVASILSSKGNPTAKAAAAKGAPPQPFVQDTTDNNVQELHSQVQAEKSRQQQDAALAAATATGANRINPLTGAQTGQGVYGTNPNPDVRQLTPVQEQQMQIESKDRELAHSSLFTSNIAYSRSQQQSASHHQGEPPVGERLLRAALGRDQRRQHRRSRLRHG